MRNIAITVEYLGRGYSGWQRQEGVPTIQETLEDALEKIACEKVRVKGSGRTDAGVNASGQVANFFTTSGAPLKAFVRGANCFLPPDISILSARDVPRDFDARRSALLKTYVYRVHCGQARPALDQRVYWLARKLDLSAVDRALAFFPGQHDFSAFRSAGCDATHTVRFLCAAALAKRGEVVEFTFTGKGFLRNMVRIMAGTVIEAGLGTRRPESVADLLRCGNRLHAGTTAPAEGLTLHRVTYPALEGNVYP